MGQNDQQLSIKAAFDKAEELEGQAENSYWDLYEQMRDTLPDQLSGVASAIGWEWGEESGIDFLKEIVNSGPDRHYVARVWKSHLEGCGCQTFDDLQNKLHGLSRAWNGVVKFRVDGHNLHDGYVSVFVYLPEFEAEYTEQEKE